MRPIFIVGTGASGTKYISKILNRIGIAVGHERRRKDGLVSWELVILSEFERCKSKWSDEPIVLHQVRDPLKTINSLRVTHGKDSWEDIYATLNSITADMPLLYCCMHYWYDWNRKAEQMAKWTYRIEDLPSIWELFCDEIGRPDLSEKGISVIANMHEDINSKLKKIKQMGLVPPRLTWDHLFGVDGILAWKIIMLARWYGYTNFS